MTQLKLSTLKNYDEVMKKIDGILLTSAKDYKARGINETIDKFASALLVVDEEELAKELHWTQGINSDPKKKERAWEICHTKDAYRTQSKLIAENARMFLRLEKSK